MQACGASYTKITYVARENSKQRSDIGMCLARSPNSIQILNINSIVLHK
jgi:hypothetical protein